ncbi:uncharacterized protein LOC127258739 [Andrographis paniculata]|uniref:uncharacterized protein LOC127258739 n=1 Tax=Andrographis paniculata TaxID=175694 RepID=UPI0021E6F740|nr:uncharacterized protein LOC127258739 [Andrographis paniculata]
MATSALLPLLLLAVLTVGAAARPCKTLFYFSATTTTTYSPYNSLSHNPKFDSIFRGHGPRHLTLIFTSIPDRLPYRFVEIDSDGEDSEPPKVLRSSESPLKFYTSVSSSIRDRSKDIISVVGALLFGVGCGALTAAVMYLVWALFSPRRFVIDDGSSSSDDDDDDDDVATIKRKLGYVAISASPKEDDGDLKKPALGPAPPTNGEV